MTYRIFVLLILFTLVTISISSHAAIDHFREAVAFPKELPPTPICFITLASSIALSWCASLVNYISRYLVRHWIALLCNCIATLTILFVCSKSFDIQPQSTTFSVSLLQISLSISLSKSSSNLSPFRRCHSIQGFRRWVPCALSLIPCTCTCMYDSDSFTTREKSRAPQF